VLINELSNVNSGFALEIEGGKKLFHIKLGVLAYY